MLNTIRNFFSESGTEIKPGSEIWLNGLNDRALTYICYGITNLTDFPGVVNQLQFLASVEKLEDNSERELRNGISEVHAWSFAEQVLNEKVVDVEIANQNPVKSPHRQSENKSCDFVSKLGSEQRFWEVKCSSTEITSRHDFYGSRMYTPATRTYIGEWIKWKCGEAGEKGATHLFLVVPFWCRPEIDPDDFFLNGWVDEVFGYEFSVLSRDPGNELAIQAHFEVPETFKTIYLPRGNSFLKVGIVGRKP